MSNRLVTITGVSGSDNQLLVNANGVALTISNDIAQEGSPAPTPTDYLLAGFAGSINAIGILIAKEMGIELKSLHVEIIGEIQTKKAQGTPTRSRAGFRNIEVIIKPESDAPLELLKTWMDEVRERCPLRDNLVNATPVLLTLYKEYNQHKAA